MKKSLLPALALILTVAPSLRAQTTPAPIPEEARKHFIMGTTLFKDAKTADDYAQVESQFKQAVDLAPQWPDPRYNLALTKEAAGDYAGAIADLKIYLQFKLAEEDARKIQDKMYVLEAKQTKRATDDAAATALAEARKPHFEGRWENADNSRSYFTITGQYSAQLSEMFSLPPEDNDFRITRACFINRFGLKLVTSG
jgi:tetratricopeptide (TPR) repeat protein